MSPDAWQMDAADSYDRVAVAYAERTRSALEELPWMRGAFTDLVRLVLSSGGGPVLDVGCGPGWITAFLVEQGIDALGIDMRTTARTRCARCAGLDLMSRGKSTFGAPTSQWMSGDLAVTWGIDEVRVATPEGVAESRSRATRVFGHSDHGWRMVHQHLSFPVQST